MPLRTPRCPAACLALAALLAPARAGAQPAPRPGPAPAEPAPRRLRGRGLFLLLTLGGLYAWHRRRAAPAPPVPYPGDAPTVVPRSGEPATPLPFPPERYKDAALIGQGGMGRVYKAYDAHLKRAVAIKVPGDADPDTLRRFKREAAALAALDHPGIVRIFDLATEPSPWFVMEHLEGTPLDQHLAAKAPLPVDEALDLVEQLLAALAHAHSQGVLHRDLKPSNVIRLDDGRLKILDFGLARLAEGTTITKADDVIGTVAYMAPELLRAEKASPQSDLYAVGVILYQALTGVLPFDGPGVFSKAFVPAPPASARRKGLPATLDAALARALAEKPADRPPDAPAFAAALAKARELAADPALETLAWMNVFLQANHQIFHPLKNRFSLVARYPGQPAKLAELFYGDGAEAEARELIDRALMVLQRLKGDLSGKAHSRLAASLQEAEALRLAARALFGPGRSAPEAPLAAAYEASVRLTKLAASVSEELVLDLAEWARALAAARPPGAAPALAVDGVPAAEVLTLSKARTAEVLARVADTLLANAAEAGATRVEVGAELDLPGDRARLAFADDGKGLPPGDPEALFQRGTTTKPQGTGQGLADARKDLAPLGGTLTAAPRPGRPGALFTLTLPLRRRLLPPGFATRGQKANHAGPDRRG